MLNRKESWTESHKKPNSVKVIRKLVSVKKEHWEGDKKQWRDRYDSCIYKRQTVFNNKVVIVVEYMYVKESWNLWKTQDSCWTLWKNKQAEQWLALY